jgi:ComF family protein
MRLLAARLRLERVLGILEALLFPPACGGCGRRGAWFCAECAALVQRDPSARCARCDAPAPEPVSRCRGCAAWPPELLLVRAPFLFDGPVRTALHRVKYRGEHARARDLGRRLAAFAQDELAESLGTVHLVVPIPLHPSRLRQRGFNQSELLAAAVAETLGLPLVSHLVRARPTPPQVGLGREARRRNIAGAFGWSGPALCGQLVLVVDDVVTTGATLSEAARALATAGAAGTIGLALAREP